jgi:hypothetical protein
MLKGGKYIAVVDETGSNRPQQTDRKFDSASAWVEWPISKSDAHVEGGKLIPDTPQASETLAQLGSEPVQVEGVFRAEPRLDVPEREKPTPAQRRARSANIKKAQAARHGRK